MGVCRICEGKTQLLGKMCKRCEEASDVLEESIIEDQTTKKPFKFYPFLGSFDKITFTDQYGKITNIAFPVKEIIIALINNDNDVEKTITSLIKKKGKNQPKKETIRNNKETMKGLEKWEHTVLSLQTGIIRQGKAMENWAKELNRLGKEGWELVAVIPMHIQMGLSGGTPQIRCFLKRRVM